MHSGYFVTPGIEPDPAPKKKGSLDTVLKLAQLAAAVITGVSALLTWLPGHPAETRIILAMLALLLVSVALPYAIGLVRWFVQRIISLRFIAREDARLRDACASCSSGSTALLLTTMVAP